MTNNAKPVFLLAGGRPSRGKKQDSLLQSVYRGFGIASPVIAYIGAASGDDRRFFGFIAHELKEAGAVKINFAVIAPKNADLKKAQKTLEAADIIFVSGGDVEAGMEVLQAKDMVPFLDNLYQQGKPFFGTSAGAIMLAAKWVRWTDPDTDSSAELFRCLGYAPIICDTHDEQGGWEELQAALMLEKEGAKGYGLSSGSAVKVSADGKVEAVGGTIYQYVRRGSKVIRIEDILPPGGA